MRSWCRPWRQKERCASVYAHTSASRINLNPQTKWRMAACVRAPPYWPHYSASHIHMHTVGGRMGGPVLGSRWHILVTHGSLALVCRSQWTRSSWTWSSLKWHWRDCASLSRCACWYRQCCKGMLVCAMLRNEMSKLALRWPRAEHQTHHAAYQDACGQLVSQAMCSGFRACKP